MNNIFIRIALLSLSAFGLYKTFPQISKPVDYYIKNPTFQNSVVIPTLKTANKVLPEKLQIPTPVVMDSPLKSITDEISRQAASIAANQVTQIKKTASDQFCQALIEKIKIECGQ